MGFALFGTIFILSLFLKSNLGQPQSMANTDEFFISHFFEKMGINSSSSSHVYNLSSSVCSWEAVFCDAKQENVIGLIAPNLGLTGPIPDNTIAKLKNLQYLDLSNNKITDFPSDFWSLISIKTLNLSNNNFSINLPTNIGNFGLLERLDLSFNNFSGSLPDSFSSLTSLQVLNLNQNQFDSIIPLGIISCHSLTSIDLSFNSFNGNLPDDFNTAFPKLKILNLAGNKIKGRGSDFSKMVSLTYLNISKNLFKGSVVEIFQGPLEVVDLSSNQFEGHISKVNFSSTFNWSHLVHLDLSDNQISGQFFSDLNQTHNLKHLNLAKNRFSKQSFIQIHELHSLEYLNLSKTNLIGQITDGITKLTHLKTLDLSNNHLSGNLPLLSFKTLQNLDLSNNNFTGEIPMNLLKKLPWMERFNFSHNNLTLCDSEFSLETLKSAFIGCSNSCPIAVNPTRFKKKPHKLRVLELASALTIILICLLVGLLICAFCRRKTRMWDVKQESCNEEHAISGPFSFKTDSTTWVADVKVASLVPVVIFEKPLLNFTFSDLLMATSNFDRDTLLAEGRFGPVYRGVLAGGVHVAIKVLVHGSTMTDHEAATELEHLGRIKHANLVPLMGYCLAGEQRIAIYDYMENGNLHNLLYDLPLGVQVNEDWSTDTWEEDEENGIKNVGSEVLLMTWRFRHKTALGTARALAFLHHGCSPPIIHRDVKASSVYLDYNLEPRLSDFGLAKIFGNGVNDGNDENALGSCGYAPPDDAITPKSDVYGFGVILLELITGKKAVGDEYPDDDNSKAPNLVSWVRGLVRVNRGSRAIDPNIRATGHEGQMVEGLKIGYLCTADLPAKRPSMQQVVGLLKDIEPLRASEEV